MRQNTPQAALPGGYEATHTLTSQAGYKNTVGDRYRIRESFRLEKTSEIPTSNPSPPHRAHCPRPSVPHPHGSGTPPWTVTPPPPWAAVPLQHCSFGEEMFPNIQPEPPLRADIPWSPYTVTSLCGSPSQFYFPYFFSTALSKQCGTLCCLQSKNMAFPAGETHKAETLHPPQMLF